MAFPGNFQNRQEIKGITLIISACDVRGRQRHCLNILLNHSPNGLELYAHAKMLSLEERSLFYARVILWQFKVDRLQILYDCNNRILLYAATVITGCQISAAPNRDGCIFSAANKWLLVFTGKEKRKTKWYEALHRGHLIPSMYGIRVNAKKWKHSFAL